MTIHSSAGTMAGRRLNSLAAGAFGAVFVIVGLLGFTVSGGHDAAGHTGGQLLGLFQVNLLHNLVHMAVGAAMIAAAIAGVRVAKTANTFIGAVYLVLAIAGVAILGDNALNVIALNGADNALHLVLGLVLLGIGLGADRR
jgi:hypothetical protein